MTLHDVRSFFIGTLRGRLVLSVAAVHAVMMALFTMDTTMRQRALLLESQTEKAEAISRSLATSAAGWIAAEDVSGMQEIVDSERRHPEILYAMLTDENGRVLAHTDQSRIGLYLLDLPEKTQTTLSKSAELVDSMSPAMLGKQHVGWARVGLGQKTTARKLATATFMGIAYTTVAILIGSFIAWIMGHRITRRLYAVQETISKVKGGERAARSGITGADEAASIALEFNAMLDALSERETQLSASENRFTRLFNVAAVPLCFVNKDGVLVDFNERFVQTFGYTHDDVPTLNEWWQLAYPDPEYRKWVVATWDNAVKRAAEKQTDIEPIEYNVTCKNGEVRKMVISGSILGDNFLATFFDVTERKKAEEVLRKAHAECENMVWERTRELSQRATELESANKELSAFSYSTSHVLRAPLRAINGISRILRDEYAGKFDEEGRRMLKIVGENAVLMGQYIEDMLEFSNTGRREVREATLDMKEVVKEAIEDLKPLAEGREIKLEIAELPQAAGDRTMIRQVFRNLISNAFKFTKPRETALIEIGGTSAETEEIYFVRDNGVGFDMKYKDKLFGVFQRLHGDEEFDGTGIGLAIVKRIVEKHGGRVWAEGKVDEGATFYFALPKVHLPAA